uniref:Uncharacterized protein n=1 Tax=Anguilla anguilla TaxID=7936 RepID=A0A0E9PYN9_ANGAN
MPDLNVHAVTEVDKTPAHLLGHGKERAVNGGQATPASGAVPQWIHDQLNTVYSAEG